MRHNLTNGSIPFRKAYLRAIIDLVEVDDTRIKGSKDVLERAVLAGRSGQNFGSLIFPFFSAIFPNRRKQVAGS